MNMTLEQVQEWHKKGSEICDDQDNLGGYSFHISAVEVINAHLAQREQARGEVDEARDTFITDAFDIAHPITAPQPSIDLAAILEVAWSVISNLGEHMEGYHSDPALVAYVVKQLDKLARAIGDKS